MTDSGSTSFLASPVLATSGVARADGDNLAKPTADQISWHHCEIGMFIGFRPAIFSRNRSCSWCAIKDPG
jgi:hypothetical protein